MGIDNDEAAEARRAMYDTLKREYMDHISTWDDFFRVFRQKMAAFQKCNCVLHLADMAFPMYAFLSAMEEMPDEGDIVILTERMVHILAYRSQEKFGTDFAVQAKLIKTAEKFLSGLSAPTFSSSGPFRSDADDAPDTPLTPEIPKGSKLH